MKLVGIPGVSLGFGAGASGEFLRVSLIELIDSHFSIQDSPALRRVNLDPAVRGIRSSDTYTVLSVFGG